MSDQKGKIEFEREGVGKLRIEIAGNQSASIRFIPSREEVRRVVSQAFLASPSEEKEQLSPISKETG